MSGRNMPAGTATRSPKRRRRLCRRRAGVPPPVCWRISWCRNIPIICRSLALWPDTLASRHRLVFGGRLADLFGFALFEFLKPQLELLDSPGHSFRRATELHPPQLGDLELQLLDFE